MDFPVYIPIGPWKVHPHLLFESLAYFIGGRIYWKYKRPSALPYYKAIWIIAGAAIGALSLAKALTWFEDPEQLRTQWQQWSFWMSGKTIVGGLLGGLIGVEIVKKNIGWKPSTGDDFVFPIIIALSIGRIGCFLTGMSDHTYGTPTALPFGVDFGDGIPRHPTQLYEIVFLMVCGIALVLWNLHLRRTNQALYDGFKFQCFLFSYLTFRLFIDFIKPTPHPYGIFNNIQIACMLGMIYYLYIWIKRIRLSSKKEHIHA